MLCFLLDIKFYKFNFFYINVIYKKLSILSNIQIEDLCKVYDLPLITCCAKDQLPKTKQIGAYVINMANHNEEGTHWVCFILHNKNEMFYFDSFGCPPPQDVVKYAGKKCIIIYNTVQIQALNTTCCGWYCIGFINWFFTKPQPKFDFIDMFNHKKQKNNFSILLKYMKSVSKK